MRDQVMGQRVGNRSGVSAKGRSGAIQQRPARRGRGGANVTGASKLRLLLGYVPLMLKLALVIVLGVLLFTGYRAAASASFFRLRIVDVQGTARASTEALQAAVQREVAGVGVWQADLKQISARLEKLPWVRSAIVSRVLPDGIRVRVAERVPRAVVRLSSGRFYWVDDDGVLLGEMQPTDDIPPFFVRGWNEEESDAARSENRERVKKYVELRRLWEGAELAERVSEVNLIDVRDVRAQLAGDDSQIEVRLGSQDLGKRLKQALEVLDGQRQTPRGPYVSYVDLTQGKRAIVGFVSGAHAVTESDIAQPEPPTPKREQAEAKPSTAKDKSKPKEDKDREKNKREETRPRRTR
jgi:cell division protein FtsQ